MKSHLIQTSALACALAFAAGANALHAQSVAGSGTVAGRLTDAATQLSLGGARITVEGTAIETFSATNGNFALTNVPAGEQTLLISYVGYPEVRQTVTVASGETTRANVDFGSETVQLDALVIEGSAVGTARAINQQRAAATFTTITASDEIGNFADQNAAESVQRLPGVALYRDQGEGRYVIVRGLNYTYTNVQLDGSSFAGADLGERATALDVVPNDALAAIEVTKVPTPDMDGEGLAGIVNIKSKSPFDFDGTAASITAQTKYTDLTEDFGYKLNGYFSTRFGEDGKYGLIISPSFEKREFGSYNFETGGSSALVEDPLNPGDFYYAPEELDFRDYEIERERKSISAGFEAKISENTSAFIRTSYNSFVDTENRYLTRFTVDPDDITAIDEDSYTGTAGRISARRLRIREKDQEVFSLLTGGESLVGNLKLDTTLGYTGGKETRPNEITGRYRPSNAAQTITVTNGNGLYGAPTITQTGGPGFADPAAYGFHRIDLANEEGEETSYDFRLNAKYDLDLSVPAYLKTGLAYRAKEKTREAEEAEITYVGAPNLAASNSGVGDYPFLPVVRPDPAQLKNLFANGTVNNFTRLFEESEAADWQSDEDVVATYLMGGVTLGKLNIVAGSRFEFTDFTTRGNVLDLDAETVTSGSASRDYTNVLPGVYLRYDATDKLVFRASWSNSIARPGFSDTAFSRSINNDDEEVTQGNPFLKELTSENWDASVEYYLPSLGLISAAVFHKNVENFSYETQIDDGFATGNPLPQVQFYDLNTFASDSSGTITGLELAYQQRLGFLPGPLSGFGVLANITFLDAEAEYGFRPGEKLDFIGQSEYVGNLGLTYETKKFFARLAMNFRGERLREDEPLRGSADQDIYVDKFSQLDLTVRYEFTKQFEVFVDVLNITDEPFRAFQKNDPASANGPGKRLVQFEEYGWSANVGLRWKL
jgi:TonB-dependent receptor